nr:MAG TPA: Baseplate J like protein [Caudoviricetes sp.]
MAENYIGINGLVTQSLEEIRASLIAKFKEIYGSDINLEQNSPDSQWINILAQEKKDILDLFTQFYNNLDPDRVIGIPQQILYKLNALIIKAYTYSYVYVNVTITEDVTLQGLDDNIDNADGTGYTVRDNNGNHWILAHSETLSSGTYLLNFRAADLGAITTLPNTITIMETVQRGVASVNNPANNYITGDTGESTSEFRLRRNKSMAVPSQGFDESTVSQMLALDNVTECKVYDNRSNEIVNDIPAHGIWVIVKGGKPEEIGRVIYNNIPPGIPMKGKEKITVPKLSGDIETVYYDLPTAVNLYIRATIKNFTTSSIDTNYIKEQLALINYDIRQMAEASEILTTIKTLLAQTGTPFNVEISTDGTNWVEYITPAGLDEYFTIIPENITLTVED